MPICPNYIAGSALAEAALVTHASRHSQSISNIIRIWQMQPPDTAAVFFTEYCEFPVRASHYL